MESEPDDSQPSSIKADSDLHRDHDVIDTNTTSNEQSPDNGIIYTNASLAGQSQQQLMSAEILAGQHSIHKEEEEEAHTTANEQIIAETHPLSTPGQHNTENASTLPSNAGNSKTKRASYSISHTISQIKQHFAAKMESNAFEIDIGPSTDSEPNDEKEALQFRALQELQDLKTNYDDNEFCDLPYEEEIMERLSIALTYLLHEESPLWTEEEDNEEDFLDALTTSISRHEDDEREYKAPPSFQHKCTEYTANGNIISQLKTAQRKLNQLYKSSYHGYQKKLHKYWVKWREFAQQKKEDKGNGDNEDKQDDFDDLTLKEEENLEEDCYGFLEKFEETMADIMTENTTGRTAEVRKSRGESALSKYVKQTTDRGFNFKMEDPTKKYKAKSGIGQISSSYDSRGAKGTPNDTYTATPGSQNKSPRKLGQLKTQIALNSNNSMLTKDDELRLIKSREDMKKWITKYKDHGFKWGLHRRKETHENVSKTNRSCTSICSEWIQSIKSIFHRDEFHKEVPLHIPMYAWTWQQLVSFIESEESYKRFSSIFWEYSINGQEICNMKAKQIELLIECSVLNNSKVFESEFDEFKEFTKRNAFYNGADAQTTNKEEWEITLAANELYEYIVKGRVQSQIVSRYYTAWDVLMQIANNNKHKHSKKAQNIRDLVSLLRSEPAEGPKKFWKMDAVFFNKIDNYLMVLIARGSVCEIYQKYWPDFLYEEVIEITSNSALPKNGTDITRQQSNSIRRQRSNIEPYAMGTVTTSGSLSPGQQQRQSMLKGLGIGSSMLIGTTPHSKRRPNSAKIGTANSQTSIASNTIYSVPAMIPNRNTTEDLTTNFSMIAGQDSVTHTTTSISQQKSQSFITYESDSLDTCVDCCCKLNKCARFRASIHSLDRVYLLILFVVIGSLTLGCSFATLWYYYGATEQTTNAMELTIQSIGDRTRNQLAFQFWIPQLFTGYLIAGLQTQSYPVDAALNADGQYDQLFLNTLETRHTETLFSQYMYNVDDNLMMGAYRDPGADSAVIRIVVDNTAHLFVYDDTGTRLPAPADTFDSVYIPKQKPWFNQSQTMSFGVSSWTEPYIFAELDDVYGMTLVTRLDYEGTEVILLVEITMDTLADALAVHNLPIDSQLFVVTPQHSVISATSGELQIQDTSASGDSGEIECVSADSTTCETLEYFSILSANASVDIDGYINQIVDQDDDVLSIFGFPFYMVYVDHSDGSETNTDYEVGFIVISYTTTYLDQIYMSLISSCIIFVVTIFISCTIVCCNVKSQKRERTTPSRVGAASVQTFRRRNSLLTLSIFNTPHSAYSTNRFKSQKSNDADDVITEEKEPDDDDEESFSITQEKDVRPNDKFVHVTIDEVDDNKENQPQTKIGATTSSGSNNDIHRTSTDIIQENKETKARDDNVLNLPINASSEAPDPEVEDKLKTQSGYSNVDSTTATLKDQSTFKSMSTDRSDASAPAPNSMRSAPFETDSRLVPQASIKKQDSELLEIVATKYCNCSLMTIIIVCVCLIGCAYLMTIGVWVYGTSITSAALVDDLMVKEEYMALTDEVYKLFDSTEMVYDVLSQIIKEGKMNLNYKDLPCGAEKEEAQGHADYFYTKLMRGFTESNGKYRQFYIYTATPNGSMHGARWRYSANDTALAIGARSGSTSDCVASGPGGGGGGGGMTSDVDSFSIYQMFDVDMDTGLRDPESYEDNNIYDPRCTGWYRNAIKHGFVGTIKQAFATTDFEAFYTDAEDPSLQSDECEDAREEYVELFNLSAYVDGNLSSVDAQSFVLNADKSVDDLYTFTWDRYEFTSSHQGITASAVVIDDLTGDVLAVVAVDYTLDDLSSVLSDNVGSESDWNAWIFEANSDEPYVIASSDSLVLVSADSVGDACIQLAGEDEEILIFATEHNNSMISIMSQEIVDVYSIESVNNISVEDGITSMTVKVPMDLPKFEVGRVRYYSSDSKQENSIDWIIAKTINTSEIESGESNDMTITFMALSVLFAATMVTFREFKVGSRESKREKNSKNKNNDDEEDLIIGDRLGYFRKLNKMKHIVEGSANILWKLACDDFVGIITTSTAKQFMAQRANQHVSAAENNSFMFLMCALEYRNKWNRLKFFEILDSLWYSVSIQFIMFVHIVTTIWEPSTPQQLLAEGTPQSIGIIIFCCLICELIDLLLIGCQRYMEFTLNAAILKQLYQLDYGAEHEYCAQLSKYRNSSSFFLIFFGPKSIRFLWHCAVFFIILCNFVLQSTMRISPFGYYIPILPMLLVLKNKYILSFLSEFFFALNFARDVLFSYLCFILIFAIFGISLFGVTVRVDERADSFRSIRQAFITSFVYISTSENYDDIVYATIDSQYYGSEQHWIILANAIFISILFVILGLFIFIPMIIHTFEEAFSERKIASETDHKNSKENAIIAAFLMLDMNGDMGIDMDEFQHLVTHSILINKSQMMADAFNYFDDDGSEELDLYEFTNHLLTQQFRDKLFVTSPQIQNKVQAWLECNVFRRYRFHILILILFVMPSFTMSLMQNLKNINSTAFDVILAISFLLNLCEIHLRWFAFGYRRFFDLKRYPNPPYVVAAIAKYTKNVAQDETNADDLIIRLSSSQRYWAVHHLRDSRPLSILEKSTLSIIHRIEFTLIWFTFLSWLATTTLMNHNNLIGEQSEGYQRYFLQLGILIRIFTLLRSNQKIIYMIFTVFSAFASLFAFLFVLIYMFARIGCTLFGQNQAHIVIDDIYPLASEIIASFDTTGSAILTLLQLMIGEGWHEVMYVNVFAQNVLYSIYFIVYILIVTIIISNVFIGLFLSDVDELKKSQSDDELKKKFNKSSNFKQYAIEKLEKLNYQLNKLKNHEIKMRKQIAKIHDLLKHQQMDDLQKQQLAGIQQINQVNPHTQFNIIQE